VPVAALFQRLIAMLPKLFWPCITVFVVVNAVCIYIALDAMSKLPPNIAELPPQNPPKSIVYLGLVSFLVTTLTLTVVFAELIDRLKRKKANEKPQER
jgi:membrane-bound acyltransferase YfiQ involved in biofilm formation